MDCREYRRRLAEFPASDGAMGVLRPDGDPSGEHAGRLLEATAHLEECPDCRSWLDADEQRMRAAVTAAGGGGRGLAAVDGVSADGGGLAGAPHAEDAEAVLARSFVALPPLEPPPAVWQAVSAQLAPVGRRAETVAAPDRADQEQADGAGGEMAPRWRAWGGRLGAWVRERLGPASLTECWSWRAAAVAVALVVAMVGLGWRFGIESGRDRPDAGDNGSSGGAPSVMRRPAAAPVDRAALAVLASAAGGLWRPAAPKTSGGGGVGDEPLPRWLPDLEGDGDWSVGWSREEVGTGRETPRVEADIDDGWWSDSAHSRWIMGKSWSLVESPAATDGGHGGQDPELVDLPSFVDEYIEIEEGVSNG